MQSKEFFIGIDVSKLTLDVSVHGTKSHIRIVNSSEGFKQLQSWLKSLTISVSDCWFVFEYTGGYEYRLVQFLQSKGILLPVFQDSRSKSQWECKEEKTIRLIPNV